MLSLLSIAGSEHSDHHRITEPMTQWMAPAVDTLLNQLSLTQFHDSQMCFFIYVHLLIC
jgi:hypothetical protein